MDGGGYLRGSALLYITRHAYPVVMARGAREGGGGLRWILKGNAPLWHATRHAHLQGAVLSKGLAPDEEEGGHDSEEHEGRQVELDEEGVAVVGLQATLGLGLP